MKDNTTNRIPIPLAKAVEIIQEQLRVNKWYTSSPKKLKRIWKQILPGPVSISRDRNGKLALSIDPAS